MVATEQLKGEHKGIKLMLNILEEVCNRLESHRKVDSKHLQQIIEFLTMFADKCHHGKEEDLLFPEMAKAGIPEDRGPIAVMLREHKQGRDYIRGMSEAIVKYRKGDKNLSSKIVKNARDYISLLRQHIDKEDNVLYPMADEQLSEDKQKELFDGFEKIEMERMGSGTHEKFHELLHKLRDVYL